MSDAVYLAVLEDRHIEIVIMVFRKLFDAVRQVEEWKIKYYENAHAWIDEEIDGWVHYVRAEMEDGPNIRIMRTELR